MLIVDLSGNLQMELKSAMVQLALVASDYIYQSIIVMATTASTARNSSRSRR